MVNEGRWIDIDLSSQRVTAYDGDEAVRTFIVSTGTSAHPTVSGQFRVYTKLYATDMAGPGYYLPDVPYTMYYYRGYAIHGTYWHSNFGTPMSHGCVNLYTPDAQWMFDFASIGTLVNVHP
jgi:lipoprotein-anchoring transpeptidase ErfK/SrfK